MKSETDLGVIRHALAGRGDHLFGARGRVGLGRISINTPRNLRGRSADNIRVRGVNGVILSLCVLEWGLGRGVVSVVVVSVVVSVVSVVTGESRPGI